MNRYSMRSWLIIGLTKRSICVATMDAMEFHSQHENADSEKREVLNEFRYLGYIEADELLDLVNRLKVGSRKYRLLLFLTKRLVSTH